MKKVLFGFGISALMVTAAWANDNDHRIIRDAAHNVISISQVVKYPDETGVTLTGQISRHIKGDDYELKDSSGTIIVEIDDDIVDAIGLKVGDHVKVIGEVDTHRYRPTDVEAVSVEKLHHNH